MAIDPTKIRVDGSGHSVLRSILKALVGPTIFPADPSGTPDANALYRGQIPKVWLDYLQTTDTINGSFNVASVTDHGAGDFSPVFDTDFASGVYTVAGISNHNSGTAFWVLCYAGDSAAKVAGSVRLNTINQTNAQSDADQEGVTLFAIGEQ